METRAQHIAIGAFILAAIAAVFGFIIWLAKVDIDRESTLYDIFFEESVAGLTTASSVLYKGVEVGSVKAVTVDPENPERVHVTIEVSSRTPVRENAVASLSFQGLTGVANIELSGGTAGSPPLTVKPGQPRPVIPSKPSPIQELFTGAPDLLNEVGLFIGELRRLVTEENRQAFRDILQNTAEITSGMAIRAELINRIIENMDTTMAEMKKAAATMDAAGKKADGLLAEDVPTMMASIRSAADSVDQLAGNLDTVVVDQKGAIDDFANQTLPEIGRLVSDARRLSRTLNRIAERLEENPREVLFSPPPPEYQPQ